MNCPECSKENQDGAQNCQFCNAPINSTTDSAKPVTIKVSRLSIIALALSVLSVLVFFPPLEFVPRLIGRVILFMPLLAIILGFVSIVRIEISGGKITGRFFAIAAVLVPIFSFLVPFWFYPPRRPSYLMVCGTNLSGIGKAMLIYANDYDNALPRAGGENSIWANKIPDWKAIDRDKAFGLDSEGTEGTASISSSLYLLVKYAEVSPEYFICKGDYKTSKFIPEKYGVSDKDLIDLWDFGPEPWKHCSYSYHIPYSKYALTVSNDPGMAVMADRNPWIPSLGWKVKDISKFNPDGDRNAIKAGNTYPHRNEAQNVLLVDGHADFQPTSFCGVDEDNIYTYQDGGDIRRGSPPQIGSQPANRADSVLVNDSPIE